MAPHPTFLFFTSKSSNIKSDFSIDFKFNKIIPYILLIINNNYKYTTNHLSHFSIIIIYSIQYYLSSFFCVTHSLPYFTNNFQYAINHLTYIFKIYKIQIDILPLFIKYTYWISNPIKSINKHPF